MTKEQMESHLSGLLEKEWRSLQAPTDGDWNALSAKFVAQFPSDFKTFMELMAAYCFPGEILNVARESNNGNDLIATAYDQEVAEGSWPENHIPFYAIGNGDYFTLDAKQGEHSGVFYRYHDDGRVELQNKTFEEWILGLPEFLNG